MGKIGLVKMPAEKHFVKNDKWKDNKEMVFCQAVNG